MTLDSENGTPIGLLLVLTKKLFNNQLIYLKNLDAL